MYSTCLFCHASLGKNDVIEHFPVGRRLAYDAAKGRLWVVCRKCARWNLTPLEERWEAIEECERQFTGTRLRVSTENVGLARLKEGLELVRIGSPMRPEFAAWRYGDQFGRRYRNAMVFGVAGSLLMATGGWSGLIFGSVVGGTLGWIPTIYSLYQVYDYRRVRAQVAPSPDLPPVSIRRTDFKQIAITTNGPRWAVQIREKKGDAIRAVFEGEAALRAISAILPIMNYGGGEKKRVQEAVTIVEQHPEVNDLILSSTRRSWVIDPVRNTWVHRTLDDPRAGVTLDNIPATTLLALEMATHEDVERRAMEGELAMLEEAWRQADEIAGIADNLMLEKPSDISARSEA